jgi:uncharacterized cupin superfamily protein
LQAVFSQIAGLANGIAKFRHNHTEAIASYLEIGDRNPDDQVTYPDDDLIAKKSAQGWHLLVKMEQSILLKKL